MNLLKNKNSNLGSSSNVTLSSDISSNSSISKSLKEKNTYNLNNYLNKIGYDLAIYLFIFTKNEYNISKEDLNILIEKYINKGQEEITKNYYNKIQENYNEMIKNDKYKDDIKKIFKNKLYSPYKKQLKYNLFLYKYKNYEKEKVNLWFINNCILRL